MQFKTDKRDYRVKCCENIKEIEAIADEWRDLVKNSCANWVYSMPEWCLSWHKTLGQEGRLKIIVVISEKGNIVGLAPMWEGAASWSELKIKKGEFISGVQADYHDLIIQRGMEEDVAPILMEGIMHFLGKSNILEFRQMPKESPNISFIRSYLKTKGMRTFERQDVSPYCNTGRDYSDIERSWSSSHRGDVKRQKKRLAQLGKLELKIYNHEQDILNDMEDFFNIHTEKWHSEGYPAIFLNQNYREFYKEIVKSMGIKGGVHFSRLSIDGMPVSYHLGFVYNQRFYWYKPAFKKEYENYSPGKVHISMLVEEAVKQELKIFDFLIGSEAYKYQWCAKDQACSTFVVQGCGARGFIGYEWLKWGRELIKKSLKGNVLQKLRALYIEGRKNSKG
jgi:CelD/BcsL family acetyltransferase involved in cellulose biosynthesis